MALLKAGLLLFVLLNPFMLSVYLHDLLHTLDSRSFSRVLARAGLIAGIVFVVFAAAGDAVFRDVLNVRFASFQIFGGIIFSIIGLQFVFQGPESLRMLRGNPDHVAGAVAMPVLIGPGTVSASVVIGSQHNLLEAVIVIAGAITAATVSLVVLKRVIEMVQERNEALVERYMNVIGRISALIIGTIAVDMILQGIDAWQRTR